MAKILIIDDEKLVRGVIKRLLEKRGYEVVEAADGPLGIAAFKEGRPDLVLLDRDLPGMTGSKVLAALRELDAKTPVLVLTGNAGAPGAERYRELGVSGIVSKGSDVDEILDAVARVLPNRKPRILIVDDESPVRVVLRRFLEAKGYEVSEAAGAEDALKAMPAVKPSLVLLDLAMPGMGGMEMLRRLRGAKDPTAVIVISGHDDLEEARQCLAMGASDYILKPFDMEYLELSVWAKIVTAGGKE
jgi:CheY-like chemotaxis protein